MSPGYGARRRLGTDHDDVSTLLTDFVPRERTDLFSFTERFQSGFAINAVFQRLEKFQILWRYDSSDCTSVASD